MTAKCCLAMLLLGCGWTLADLQRVDPVFEPFQGEVDAAVERGLQFLAGIQDEDGSFDGSNGEKTGLVALAGMAYLSKGYLPGRPPYGDTINRCIDYILDNRLPSGLLAPQREKGVMYSHNICTLFLSEVSGMVDPERQDTLQDALAMALNVILAAQQVKKNERHQGGWRYNPDSNDSDASCSGWALMALRSARQNGASVPDRAIEDAVRYLLHNHNKKTGQFGYQDPNGHSVTLTGMAVLCLELCGRHGDPMLKQSGDYVLRIYEQMPRQGYALYGNYYTAQAMFQLGGAYWATYAGWMYDYYLPRQLEDGSWKEKDLGPAYNTSMMILAFTVPYRQLPIYQRDETVDEERDQR